MNVEERGNPPHKTPSKSIAPRHNNGFALEGMTAAELETLLRDLYDFYLLEGIYGAPVADKLLELEDKISFLKLGNEATA